MSSRTQVTGGLAEDEAARFLEGRGLRIVGRNYRTRLGEIDLIARDGEWLVFVEVRMRSSGSHGGALESITKAKRGRIIVAARQYLMRFRDPPPCRFDVISVDLGEVGWTKGAFEAS